jgi:hypothetical protein
MSEPQVNARLGCNLAGRLAIVLVCAERGEYELARAELLALLKFFPPRPRTKEVQP